MLWISLQKGSIVSDLIAWGCFVAIMSRLHVVKPLSCESALTLAENFPFFSVFPSIIEDLSQAEQLATCINMPRLAGKKWKL